MVKTLNLSTDYPSNANCTQRNENCQDSLNTLIEVIDKEVQRWSDILSSKYRDWLRVGNRWT